MKLGLVIGGIALSWIGYGIHHLRHKSGAGGVLAMMSDKRSCHYNWLAIPAQIPVILLWPIGEDVAWICFHLARAIPFRRKPIEPWDPSVLKNIKPNSFVNDLDINSLYQVPPFRMDLGHEIKGTDVKLNEFPKDCDFSSVDLITPSRIVSDHDINKHRPDEIKAINIKPKE